MAEISDTEEDSKRPPDFDWNSAWWWNSSDDDVGYESPDLDQTLHMVLLVKNRTYEQKKRGCQRYVEKVGAFVHVWVGNCDVEDYRKKHPFAKTFLFHELEKAIQSNELFGLEYTIPLAQQIQDFIEAIRMGV